MQKLKELFSPALSALRRMITSDSNNIYLYVVLLLLVNVFAQVYNFRVDLTREQIFTLSDASVRAVRNLDDPMIVKVFFTPDLPVPYSNVKTYLKDLLDEYKNKGDKKFTFEFVDMKKESSKDEAESYGVYPIQIQQRENDQFKASNAYMGLAIVHGDLIEVVNELVQPDGLEYRLTTTMQKMKSKVNILADLEGNIEVTAYASDSLQQFNIYGFNKIDQIVRSVTERLSQTNSGKITYSFVRSSSPDVIDPIASQYGIDKQWKEAKFPDGQTIAAGRGLLGIIVKAKDRVAILNLEIEQAPLVGNRIAGLDNIEQRIASSIDSLLSDNPAIGYVTKGTRQLEDQQQGAAVFRSIHQDMYEVKEIDLTTGVPEDIRTLIINGAMEQFTDTELYHIDNFVMRGGSLFVFAESFREIQQQQQFMGGGESIFIPVSTGLEKMLESYGARVNKDYVMDKKCYVNQQGAQQMELFFAPKLGIDSFNKKNPISKYMKMMIFLKVSSVDLLEDVLTKNSIKSTILASSSPKSWVMKDRISLVPFMINPPEESEMKRYNLAVLLEGKFKPYFNEPPVEIVSQGEFESSSHLKEALAPGKIVVIGTSEITLPNFLDPQGRYPNSIFLRNITDYLNGNSDTPLMRAKGIDFNPLKEIKEREKNFFKIFNIGGLPILIVLIGLGVWHMRKMRRAAVQRMFSKGEDKQ